MRSAFDHFDKNRSGYLDYRELRNALRRMGFDVSTRTAIDVLRAYDDHPDGKLDVHEFDNLVRDLNGARPAAAVNAAWRPPKTRHARYQSPPRALPPPTHSSGMSGQIKKVLGWSVAQVEAWLRRVGLSDVVGAFRAASIDGTALLELAPATMRSTLRIHDEGTLLRICEALEPLKEQWRQHRVAHGMPPSPTGKGADRALKPWGYGGDRGAKLYDHSGPEYSDRDRDARIPDRRRRSGKPTAELVVTLGAVTELPPSAAGAYVVLELDGERTKSAALPIADEIEGSGVPVELQSFSLPVTAAADRGVLSLETIAWTPTSGERSLGRTKLAVAECKRHGCLATDAPVRAEVRWVDARPAASAQWYKPDEDERWFREFGEQQQYRASEFNGAAAPVSASVRAAFDHFDKNRSGYLDYRELRRALHHMGLNVSTSASIDLLRAYDDYPDGKLDVHEFAELVRDLGGGGGGAAAAAPSGPAARLARRWSPPSSTSTATARASSFIAAAQRAHLHQPRRVDRGDRRPAAHDDYPDGKLDVHEFGTLVRDLKSASAAPAVAGVGYLDAQEWDTSTGMPRPAWQYEPAHASRPRSAPARRVPEGSVDYYGPTPVSELRRQQQVYDEEVAARQAEYYAETVDFMQTLRGVSPKVVLA